MSRLILEVVAVVYHTAQLRPLVRMKASAI